MRTVIIISSTALLVLADIEERPSSLYCITVLEGISRNVVYCCSNSQTPKHATVHGFLEYDRLKIRSRSTEAWFHTVIEEFVQWGHDIYFTPDTLAATVSLKSHSVIPGTIPAETLETVFLYHESPP